MSPQEGSLLGKQAASFGSCLVAVMLILPGANGQCPLCKVHRDVVAPGPDGWSRGEERRGGEGEEREGRKGGERRGGERSHSERRERRSY